MNIQRNQWLISRRHALRGIGSILALPLLDCMRPARAAAAGTAHLPPTRTLVTFTGMGFHQHPMTMIYKQTDCIRCETDSFFLQGNFFRQAKTGRYLYHSGHFQYRL